MKYLLGFIFGLLLGAFTAGAVFFFNPLTEEGGLAAASDATSLSYSLSDRHLLALTHNEQLGLVNAPNGVPRLWESGIDKALVEVVALEDESGSLVGIGTKIGVPSEQSNLVSTGLLVDDLWLVTLPGRGSLYAEASSNLWPLVKDTLIRVDLMNQAWPGPKTYDPVIGPAASAGRVVGISGEFVDATGTVRERIRIDDYSRTGFKALSSELSLSVAAEPQ